MIGQIKQKKYYSSLNANLNKNEFYNLNTSLLGFIGILGVIYIHSNNISTYGLYFENGIMCGIVGIIETLVVKLSSVANAYFFMISGYHFYQGISKKEILSKLFRRIKTLIIPYFIAVCVSILYYYIISIIPGLMEKLGMPPIIWTV